MSRRDGYIRKGENGRYYAEIERAPDPITGKRRRLALGGFDDKERAARAIRKALDRLERGWDDPGRITLAQHLEGWLADAAIDLSPTTAALYRTIVDTYIVPRIGGEKLKAVTPAMLTRLYADLLASGGKGGRGLAPRTVRNVHRTIRTALESAIDARRLDWNPAASKATKIPRMPRPELDVWTPAELGGFLEAVRGDRLAALYIVGAVTGMRRGELVGLRWRDVDLEARTLKVRRTIVQYGRETWEKEPKSARSRRTYANVDERAIAALKAHRKHQAAERLVAGPAWVGSGRVFTDELGRDLKPDSVTRGMERLVRIAGLPEVDTSRIASHVRDSRPRERRRRRIRERAARPCLPRGHDGCLPAHATRTARRGKPADLTGPSWRL